MNIFNKFNQALIFCFVLSFGMMSISASTIDTNSPNSSYTNELFDIIKQEIHYPQTAVSFGVEGGLIIKLTINSEGNIISKNITQHSGSKILDYEVLRMLGRIQSFPRIPTELKLKEFNFEVPVNFVLTD